jgi:nucleotide-binding universal stress UspA family protein
MSLLILAAIDGTDASDDVARTAAMLTQTLAGAELHFVHVLDPTAGVARANGLLDKTLYEARERFGTSAQEHVASGPPAREIVSLAARLGADLVVVGPHRKTATQRLILGSVSEEVVRHARCAVLVARPKDHAADGPALEPPCPDCVEKRTASGDATAWCVRHDHASKHPRAHVHYELPPAFARGSLLLRPDAE